MPHVLIAGYGELHPDGIALLESRPGLTHETLKEPDRAQFLERLPEADALLIRTAPLPAEVLQVARRLKVVSRHGVGYDNIPVEELTRLGIPLAVIDSVNATSVAEHTLFLILAVAKSCISYDRAVREGNWAVKNSLTALDLAGKSLLLLGLGRVGREVALRAQAFGMRVLAADPAVSSETMNALEVEKVENWRAVLPQVDVISLHLPRTPDTENVLGSVEFVGMKSSAIVVNTARGGLIDEKALIEALQQRRIAGAGLDTFQTEPLPTDHPLLELENVVLSPHSAALTQECMARMSVSAAQNVLDGLDGKLNPRLVVNLS